MKKEERTGGEREGRQRKRKMPGKKEKRRTRKRRKIKCKIGGDRKENGKSFDSE